MWTSVNDSNKSSNRLMLPIAGGTYHSGPGEDKHVWKGLYNENIVFNAKNYPGGLTAFFNGVISSSALV